MNVLDFFEKWNEQSSRVMFLLKKANVRVPANVLKAWEVGGLLSPEWKENGELSRSWMNVCPHVAAVGLLGYRLALPIKERLSATGYEPEDIFDGGLVHDWYKRREQEMRDEAERLGGDIPAANRRAELTSAGLIAEFGFNESVCRLLRCTGDLGMEMIRDGKADLGQKLLFYADCCVDGDRITTYKERFDAVLVHFLPGGRYVANQAEYLKKYGKTHREVWDSVVLPLQDELAQLMGFKNDPMLLPVLEM